MCVFVCVCVCIVPFLFVNTSNRGDRFSRMGGPTFGPMGYLPADLTDLTD